MNMHTKTARYQSALAGYCRTGVEVDLPGIHADHITHYRKMVLNVVDEMLRNAFPLTEELFSSEEWESTVHNFFAHHPCSSPQVWYMPKEFHEYVSGSRIPVMKKYPFLKDLLSLEWTEMDLFMREDCLVEATSFGDILFSPMVLNPDHELLALQYPVHRVKAGNLSLIDKGQYFVIAHRNPEGSIIFTDCTAVLIRMIEYLASAPLTLKQLLEMVETEFSICLSLVDQKSVAEFFGEALEMGLIKGFKI